MRAAALAVALAACSALLAACGGSDDSSSHRGAAANASRPHVIPALQDASCADWMRAGARDRGLLLKMLEASRAMPVTGRGARGEGSVLDPQSARRMFDAYCARPHFQAMRLYKVYAFAADFVGRPP